jgi:hypothetical protein
MIRVIGAPPRTAPFAAPLSLASQPISMTYASNGAVRAQRNTTQEASPRRHALLGYRPPSSLVSRSRTLAKITIARAKARLRGGV